MEGKSNIMNSQSLKFAYLIMICKCTHVLEKLIMLLDDERNDIYIHVDAKSEFDFELENYLRQIVHKSNLYFTPNRTKVFWGHYSQVVAEYALFETAYKTGNYKYYHLLSDTDLPIKTQDYIHSFFNKNNGYEFIGFSPQFDNNKIELIHCFPNDLRKGKLIHRLIRNLFLGIQKFLNLHKQIDFPLKKGTNWVSVTQDFVTVLLSYKDYIVSNYRYSANLDEFYKQTIIYNTPDFFKKVWNYDDEFIGCMRLIDWNRGSPYEWNLSDWKYIQSSELLFCRKIGDDKLADLIYDTYKL